MRVLGQPLAQGSLLAFGPTVNKTNNYNSENKSWPMSTMTLQGDNNTFPASFCWHSCRIIHILHFETDLQTSDWSGDT